MVVHTRRFNNEAKRKKKKLWEEISRVLREEWDPIGINQPEEANDEYNGYIPSVYKLLLQNESAKIIVHRLNEHVRVNMGLQPNLEHNLFIAQRLISLKEQINE
jgi:hypothetical protein